MKKMLYAIGYIATTIAVMLFVLPAMVSARDTLTALIGIAIGVSYITLSVCIFRTLKGNKDGSHE
ncbi:MAG: hypothetical protein ACREA9_27460 [Pyrinomonadaceae bacterium]